ncbi:MAG: hypothetical protein Q8Q52_06215 [Acidimicrobiia bacterium]|nr:hypothetical protein [Acidimicrobiia bacterium]
MGQDSRIKTVGSVGTPTSQSTGTLTADRMMCRVLGVRDGFRSSAAEAQRSFQRSVFYSGTRCLLAYVVFPFVLPLVGMTAAVEAPVGLAVGVVATVSIVSSLRRFFGSVHRFRWWYAGLSLVMLGFVVVLIVNDLRQMLL